MILDPQTPPIVAQPEPQTLSIPPEVANAPEAQAQVSRLSGALPQWQSRAALPPAGRAPAPPAPYQPQAMPQAEALARGFGPQMPMYGFNPYAQPQWSPPPQQWQPPPWAQQQMPPWMQGGWGMPPQQPQWQSPWGNGGGRMNPWQPQQPYRNPWQPQNNPSSASNNTGIAGGLPQNQAPKPPTQPQPQAQQPQYGAGTATPIVNKQNETY